MNDFLLDGSDLAMEDGDLVVGYCDDQNQSLLLMSDKGDFHEFPDRCVGVELFLKDEETKPMLNEIKQEFERDGLKISKISINENYELTLNANY